MTNIFSARVRHKRDTSANWTQENPVLLNTEIVIVDMANGRIRLKAGDGLKAYNELSFIDRSAATETTLTSEQVYVAARFCIG